MTLKQLQRNKLLLIVNLLGLAPLFIFMGQAILANFDSAVIEELVGITGEMSIRWLLFTLAITPLNSAFGWRKLLTVRKVAGLYSFAYGLLHLIFYAGEFNLALGRHGRPFGRIAFIDWFIGDGIHVSACPDFESMVDASFG